MHCGMYQMYHALILVGNIVTVQLFYEPVLKRSRTQERQKQIQLPRNLQTKARPRV